MKLTVINIAYEIPYKVIAEIEEFLDYETWHNPAWNGASFIIIRDDFTCIPEDDSIAACALLEGIQRVIDQN